MAQQSAKLVAQLRNHQQRDKTLTEIKSNLTAIGQHGFVLLNLVRIQLNEEDKIVSELVASINLLSKMSVFFLEGYIYIYIYIFEFYQICVFKIQF